MDASRDFLVVRTDFAGRFCAEFGEPDATMERVRAVAMAMLRDGRVVGEFDDRWGRSRVYDCRHDGTGRRYRVRVVYGTDRSGKPKVAPDGRKRMVYAVDLARLPEAANVGQP